MLRKRRLRWGGCRGEELRTGHSGVMWTGEMLGAGEGVCPHNTRLQDYVPRSGLP